MEKQAVGLLFDLMILGFLFRGIRKIHLLSDALKVIRAINGLMDWTIYPILLDINELSSKFEDILFSHISKGLNHFAHGLAKNSYRPGFVWN